MTLQVVLLGSNGIVIASDTCGTNFNPSIASSIRTTESVQKIEIVDSKFLCMFAGDECAKSVGAAVSRAVGENPDCLSATLIDEISNSTQDAYRRAAVPRDRVDYREVIWIRVKDGEFIIWRAVCGDRNERFEVPRCQMAGGSRVKVLTGDKSNPALYILENYYDRYPLRDVLSLKKLAAHAILTGANFSSNVRGLEMVVGNSDGFTAVTPNDLQELSNLSITIHDENDRRFRCQLSAP